MIKVMRDDTHADIDHESYEDIRSISMDLENEILDPEA